MKYNLFAESYPTLNTLQKDTQWVVYCIVFSAQNVLPRIHVVYITVTASLHYVTCKCAYRSFKMPLTDPSESSISQLHGRISTRKMYSAAEIIHKSGDELLVGQILWMMI